MVKARERLLVLRFCNYKKHDFLSEHRAFLEKEGVSWFLKLGKLVPQRVLDEILAGSKGLILKAPKAVGGMYYYCSIIDAKNAFPDSKMNYPDYYKKLIAEMDWFSLEGTWFCVNSFIEMNSTEVSKLRLINNDRPLDEVLSQARTTMLHAYSIEDIDFSS